MDDVYFRPAYCALYARPDDSSELFVFEMEGEVFALPWLVRPIESPAVRSLFDFETPYGYGGPLSTSSDPAFLGAAWNALEGHCSRRGIVCGFIRFHPLLENHRWVHSRSVTVVNDRQTVVLTLSKERDRVLADYSPDTRRNVRKGEKAGVKISVHTDAASLKVFACLYAAHMKELDAHDDYLFGEGYFNAVPTLGNGAWRVYLAERQGEVLGGALILLSGRWAHYHLSSSLKAHNAFAPNAMLRHAVTMDLLGKSQERLHYGGGRTAAADDSLLRFKGGFSPERAAFHFGGLICDPAAYEAICSHWAWTRPDLAEKYGGRFLRYRYK
ncbi:MAG TPA: GNAT family N-acetyltransferase [Thermoanaerobaculia bacterium]|nr:GNAT family N-acetyltransferase [Thermoanaerobaculia bacterium]